MPGLNDGEWRRKATLQHYLTILVKSLNGESVAEIARSLKMEERSVQRDLEYVRNNWSGRVSGAPKANAPQLSSDDLLAKTSCARCGDTIDKYEYRVVVAASEVQDDRGGDGIPVHRSSFLKSFCDVCVATAETFEFRNPWKQMIELDAQSAHESSPSTEDVSHRWVSGHGDEGKGAGADCDPDDEEVGTADLEANMFSASSRTLPGPEPAGEATQKMRVLRYLNDPQSRGKMRAEMRDAARMWAEGRFSQREVAQKLGKDQATMSRWIKAVQVMAASPR